jgi:L-lactate dehydrogenase complex protein LldG
MKEARDEILARVRLSATLTSADRNAEFSRIPRQYVQAGTLDSASRLAMFRERLHDYNADTNLCTHASLAVTIALCLSRRSKSNVLIPSDFPESWLPSGFQFIRDQGLDYDAIDQTDGAITGCTVAVATTGTIILQDGASAQGRRALSLIPDYHLCLVEEAQIVETVPEAVRAIEKTGTMATTTISGPSATSDIEMIRIKGVHGPRTLEVIIIQ